MHRHNIQEVYTRQKNEPSATYQKRETLRRSDPNKKETDGQKKGGEGFVKEDLTTAAERRLFKLFTSN